MVSDLLRGRLGFTGYVNSDTGMTTQRAWALEGKTVPERVAAAIIAGVDVLSGFNQKQTIVDLVRNGLVTEARIDEAVARLLVEQFRLGLFETRTSMPRRPRASWASRSSGSRPSTRSAAPSCC